MSLDKKDKIKELIAELVADMPESVQEQMHKDMTQKLVGDFIEVIHKNNVLFKMGGNVEAVIAVSGGVTYSLKLDARTSTTEEEEQVSQQEMFANEELN